MKSKSPQRYLENYAVDSNLTIGNQSIARSRSQSLPWIETTNQMSNIKCSDINEHTLVVY